ncbi:MAG: DUF2807 domain-containing protein [Candidatus Doudnabacteria bacterium]|nr:DUF2807 domain-containing protein [Candidatus Doudnabacteria bacterium]
MKKTISITINGMVFNIEEDAFARLNAYLEALKLHFGSASYGKEVVDDIESRIAEQFSGKVHDRRKEAVNLAEVEEVIKTMGTVQDLAGNETGKQTPPDAPSPRKKLFRNPDDQIIAGVAGGIATYFNIDPLIPRLLLVVSALAGGYGLLLYIILWIIVPEAQTGSEKLEMKGNPVTIANLEEHRKESQANPQKFSVIRFFFRELFYLIGRFFRTLGPIISTLIGLFLTAAAFVAIFATTLFTIILLINPHTSYIDPTISQVFSGNQYAMLVISGFVAVIIPALTGLLLGIGLVRRKNTITKTVALSFVVLWMTGALTFGSMAASAAPQIQAAVKSSEQQPTVSQEFSVPAFFTVKAQYNQQVKIVHGPVHKVIIYGREKELKKVQVHVSNNTLFIDQRSDGDDFQFCLFCIRKPVAIEITMPEINSVNADEVSKIDVLGFEALKDFNIEATDASTVNFTGRAEKITLIIDNVANVNLQGGGQSMIADLSNASKLLAKDYIVAICDIDVTNASQAEINVTQKLTAEASNAGHIIYSGNPVEKAIEESNAGKIIAR